jgi:hypothetical protein
MRSHSKRSERRAADARESAYAAQERLVAAVRSGAHPLRIAKLAARARSAWAEGARLHGRGLDASWRRVALWHLMMLRHGVVEAGLPVPGAIPLWAREGGIHPFATGAEILNVVGPVYGAGLALTLDGREWVPHHGYYVESLRTCPRGHFP